MLHDLAQAPPTAARADILSADVFASARAAYTCLIWTGSHLRRPAAYRRVRTQEVLMLEGFTSQTKPSPPRCGCAPPTASYCSWCSSVLTLRRRGHPSRRRAAAARVLASPAALRAALANPPLTSAPSFGRDTRCAVASIGVVAGLRSARLARASPPASAFGHRKARYVIVLGAVTLRPTRIASPAQG